eukprot:Gregarina_sp_Pseudo_9__1947@NODE_233_length_3487_cov_75_999420_g217_i0_p2_GENE_NODE_233_length_3487_cov_75_999420_g217_i0NODE_233_length_3487_cov_75_999420_g217_i0_p2_ORF_typecomplete_len372_score38_16Sua5_yciO_yrdC/PF01300_18/2_6e45SUA5/PF03481_13/6_5e12zfdskA_traR/PF01258_17/0_11_NODE_233_length_3487_cov_75_999420_g217_i023293444
MRVFKVRLDEESAGAYNECGKSIREGRLVAFPTETVYGLGADGLNKEALFALFEAKKRPLNDPVILHVASGEDAFQLWDLSDSEAQVIRKLQQAFWPGPCTIVARQAKCVPDEATAGSGFASSRMPSHPVARRFIESAGCPVAGPSANLFGRITPTRASHVQKYFADSSIDLLECDDCCGVGIESTVVKVSSEKSGSVTVQILRHGAVTSSMVKRALAGDEVAVIVQEATKKQPHVAEEGAVCESPGQLLRHYAPTMRTCLLLPKPAHGVKALDSKLLASAVLVDIANEFAFLREQVVRYYVISKSLDNYSDIARCLFKALHEAEAEAEANNSIILLGVNEALANGQIEELRGVYDRLFRAATGELVCLPC